MYDRDRAIKYAETWWNAYNNAFPIFSVDCTNYVSQCLFAGNAPMWGSPNTHRGWWCFTESWSLSWSVAHSLYWYLKTSTKGLYGVQVESEQQLDLGDVIFYDFQNDGRWDHTTIVTVKNEQQIPFVNAHTDNSRYRYWTYEDSAAWTRHINYAFMKINVK